LLGYFSEADRKFAPSRFRAGRQDSESSVEDSEMDSRSTSERKNPDGNVLYRHTGEMDFLELRRKIVPALNKITPWPGMSDAR